MCFLTYCALPLPKNPVHSCCPTCYDITLTISRKADNVKEGVSLSWGTVTLYCFSCSTALFYSSKYVKYMISESSKIGQRNHSLSSSMKWVVLDKVDTRSITILGSEILAPFLLVYASFVHTHFYSSSQQL
jgi:hypothetical protein